NPQRRHNQLASRPVAGLLEQRAGSGARATRKSDSDFGGIIIFRFRDGGHIVMKVLELEHAKLILWQVVGGSTEWGRSCVGCCRRVLRRLVLRRAVRPDQLPRSACGLRKTAQRYG